MGQRLTARRAALAALVVLLGAVPAFADSLADGIAAYQRGDDEAAEHLLLDASSAAPLDPRPYEWLARVYERRMEPQQLDHALTQAHRLQARLRQKHDADARAAAEAKQRQEAKQPRTSIHLNQGSMPAKELAEVESLLAPLQAPAPVLPPPASTPADKHRQLEAMQGTLGRLQNALATVRQRLAAYAAAPVVVKQKLDRLQGDVDKYTHAVKQLKQELGEDD